VSVTTQIELDVLLDQNGRSEIGYGHANMPMPEVDPHGRAG
jgi:hypothetical protein